MKVYIKEKIELTTYLREEEHIAYIHTNHNFAKLLSKRKNIYLPKYLIIHVSLWSIQKTNYLT